jgi:hypothetical protein
MTRPEGIPQPPGSAAAYPWLLAGVGSWALAAGLQQVLFAWLLVGELHESGGRVGFAQMCLMLPSLLFLLPGGLLADRSDLAGCCAGCTWRQQRRRSASRSRWGTGSSRCRS